MVKKHDTKTPKSKRPKFARRLMELRKSLGWSQRRLAEEFYVSVGAVANWEIGERPLTGPALKLVEIYEAKIRNKN